MADAEQPPAKRSRFDTSNGQAAPSARAPGAAPAKKPTAEAAKAAMVKAKAALERMRALKASKVTACPAFQCSPTRNDQIAKALHRAHAYWRNTRYIQTAMFLGLALST